MKDSIKIMYLRLAQEEFLLPPLEERFNDDGLCLFFSEKYGLNNRQIRAILGQKQSKNVYHFCMGCSQSDAYRYSVIKEFRFDRSKWCKLEADRLEKKNGGKKND